MQKTKTAVMKETVKCSHNIEYGYSMWHTIDPDATDKTSWKQYTYDFREYEYDLCKSCMDTVVNGLTVEQWITIEKALVWGVLVYRDEINDSVNRGRETGVQKRLYDNMEANEAAIETIRRNMVKRIRSYVFYNIKDLEVTHTALKTQRDIYRAEVGDMDLDTYMEHFEEYSKEFQEAYNNMEHCQMLMYRIEAKGLDHISVPQSH